jgi:hypothetical protein
VDDIPSCPLPHTCQLCLSALSKLEFFSLALRKIALSLKCFSHPFFLPPYPFSLHVHEEDRKDEVNEEERNSEEEVIRRMMMTTEEKRIRRR